MTYAHPLRWPLQKPRTPAIARKTGQFGTVRDHAGSTHRSIRSLTLYEAMKRLREELVRIGVKEFTFSSDIAINRDGSLSQRGPVNGDPGVAIYFDRKGQAVCLPCDTYQAVADNIAAIAAHIEKTRAIERYGVASITEMFSGFTAIAAPGAKHWTAVLGLDLTAAPSQIKEAHLRLYKQRATMGSPEAALTELNAARDQALKERS